MKLAVRCGASLILLLFGTCDSRSIDAPVYLHIANDTSVGVDVAIRDLAADLEQITGRDVVLAPLPAPPCEPGELHVAVLPIAPALGNQGYSIRETRCASGHAVTLTGGAQLPVQWAIYDLMHRLGVRYLHPERTLYPNELRWPAEPIDVVEEPAFRQRSIHVHRTHPVELSRPLGTDGDDDAAAFQRRWIDWNVKLRQTQVDGWDADVVGDYAYARGFPRTAGLNLLNAQQGGRPLLDPADRDGELDRIADAIDQRVEATADRPRAAQLGVQFNPSELTEADPEATVERLRFIADYVERAHPDVQVYAINHGTAQAPVQPYGVRFFDLPALASGTLGALVHPLMFYDLERPAAGVYGNDNYVHLLRWIEREQARRRIVHYPEASWWLTFDIAVPLYLAPATLEARARDIELLAPYLSESDDAATGVYGHRLFSSGQEWGYWLVDYCVAQMAWDAGVDHRDCIDDFADQLAAADVVKRVLHAAEARQIRDMRDPDLVRLLVGSDDETETAAEVGFALHPLPPAPGDVGAWSDARVAALARTLDALRDMARDYHAWADVLDAVEPAQTDAQAPWLREIRDGMRAFALRAEHAVAVYDAAIAWRTAGDDRRARAALAERVAAARAVTDRARAVVRAREADYRYPLDLSIARGPNRTIYPYRYLARTHDLTYWTRPDDQLAATVARPVTARAPAIATADTATGDAIVVDERLAFAKGSLAVVSPPQAKLLEGLLPGLVIGLGPDFMVVAPLDGARDTADAAQVSRRPRAGASDLPISIPKVGDLVLYDAIIDVTRDGVRIDAELSTDQLIERLVSVGGFDDAGARRMVAGMLGYTQTDLPARIPFAVAASY